MRLKGSPLIDRVSEALYSETMTEKSDVFYMKRAIRLARKGRGKTSPNPMVGAIVVRDGAIVGAGYHRAVGQAHAEVIALKAAGEWAKGGTLYTTLEPCCHTHKRTPPCTDAIIQSGIIRLVSAMQDPNAMVNGKGFETLRQAGIKAFDGVLRLEAEKLNEVFIKYMKTGKPFVTLKAAMTLDGRIATASGESKWISGEKARKEVDRLRADADAVLVGIGTVLADDPMLVLRSIKGRNPMRIVIDPHLKIPLQAKIVVTAKEIPTWLLTTIKAAPKKMKSLKAAGVDVSILSEKKGIIPFDVILDFLGKKGISNLLIEGGAGVNGIALRSALVDRVIFYIAPRFLCGEDAKGVVAGKAIPGLDAAIRLEDVKVRQLGEDIRIEGRIQKS